MTTPLHGVTKTLAASPLEAFTADIRRPPLSPLYTIGLAVVAFAMVLLPAIYLALIVLTGWGVLYHLTHNTWIMTGRGGGLGKLILYLGPAVAGGTLVFFMLKPLLPLLTEASFPQLADRDAAVAQWQEARERSEQLRFDAAKASAEIVREQQRLVDFTTARHLTATGFKVEPKEFSLPTYATAAAEQETAAKLAIEESTKAIEQQTVKLGGFVEALRKRVSLALRLRQSAGGSTWETTSEAEVIAATLAVVGAAMASVHQIGMRLRAFTTLAQNRGNQSNPADVDAEMSRLAGELKTLIADVDSHLSNLPYPLPHPRGQLSVVEYARYEKPCQNEWETVYRESDSRLDRIFALH